MSILFDAVVRRSAGTMLETIGLRLLEINEEHAVAEMRFRPGLDQFTGVFHTGALLTLADSTATSACLYATDPDGTLEPARFPLAVQLSANLIRNTGSGVVTSESRLIHRGRTTMVAETSVRDEQGRLLLLLTSTHLILAR